MARGDESQKLKQFTRWHRTTRTSTNTKKKETKYIMTDTEVEIKFLDLFEEIENKHEARVSKLQKLKQASEPAQVLEDFDDVDFQAGDLAARLASSSQSEAAVKQIQSRIDGTLEADLCELYPQAVHIARSLTNAREQEKAAAVTQIKEIAKGAALQIEVKACTDEVLAEIPSVQAYGNNKANFVRAMVSYLNA